METIEMNTEAAVVADLAKQSTEIQAMTIDGVDGEKAIVVGVPKHLNILDLTKQFDEDRGYPNRAKGIVHVASVESFCKLVNQKLQHSVDETAILYYSRDKAMFEAVLNDHGAKPGFRDYAVQLQQRFSDEWKAWTAQSGKPMAQSDFAEFLEEHTLDVIDQSSAGEKTLKTIADLAVTIASPATLRSLTRDFSVRVKQTVREARSLASGETQFLFATEHAGEDGKPLVVPGGFLIAIPVFKNGPLYTLIARLRYRLIDGKILWSFKLERLDKTMLNALDESIQTIANELPTICMIEATSW